MASLLYISVRPELAAADAEHASFRRGLGADELDRLLDSENAKVGGFPLRQLVTTRTKYDVPARSKLERPSMRTMTRETWVTKIQEINAEPSQFTIPVTYRRADQPDLPRTATQTLTFDSGSK